MSKGDGSARGNLRATRAQINNASTSAQTRAFKARQLAKQKRDADERKLRAAKAAKTAKDASEAKAAAQPEVSAGAGDEAKPTASKE
jgi:hypothetical protein